MFQTLPWLSLLICLPVLGVLVLLSMPSGQDEPSQKNAARVALWASGGALLLTLYLILQFPRAAGPGFALMEQVSWISAWGFHYHVGVDSISLLLLLLTTSLTFLAVLFCFQNPLPRNRESMIAFLALESCLLGLFCALDLFVFCVFFQALLVPMFFAIGTWGGMDKVQAGYRFFLHALVSALLLLVGVVFIYVETGSTDLLLLQNHLFCASSQRALWLIFFLAFALKVPLWPFHTWLPQAQAQAPTAACIVMAGVFSNVGVYGLLRVNITLFPEMSQALCPYVWGLGVVSMLWGALAACAQTDVRRLLAYASISHMGLLVVGLFSLQPLGLQGAVIQMAAHSLTLSTLFLSVGFIYERIQSHDLKTMGGMLGLMPFQAGGAVILAFSLMAVPGTLGFVGIFWILMGFFQQSIPVALALTLGVFASCVYGILFYQKIFCGGLSQRSFSEIKDLSSFEGGILLTFVLLIVGLGLFPGVLGSFVKRDVVHIATEAAQGQRPALQERVCP